MVGKVHASKGRASGKPAATHTLPEALRGLVLRQAQAGVRSALAPDNESATQQGQEPSPAPPPTEHDAESNKATAPPSF